ncbi:hypothetical protein [Mangrovimonas cancribranchiae]|uniref:Uncharacterized protein n=1 Tax=Mangrovimonas cancribranchiae TaxID=3080055 RepID=A0AAU6P532_9FLAO
MIDLKTFKEFSKSRQVDEILSSGKVLDTHNTKNLKIISYQMNGFIVDMQYDLKTSEFLGLYYGN